MGLKLKQGKTYKDKSGNVYDNAYAMIIMVNKHNLENKSRFDLAIFASKEIRDTWAKDNRVSPVGSKVFVISNGEFEALLSAAALSPADVTAESRAYEYIKAHEIVVGQEEVTVTDEDGEEVTEMQDVMELEFKDWEDCQE